MPRREVAPDQDKFQCSWGRCISYYMGSRPPEGWILIGTATGVVVLCPDCERTFRPLRALFYDDPELASTFRKSHFH